MINKPSYCTLQNSLSCGLFMSLIIMLIGIYLIQNGGRIVSQTEYTCQIIPSDLHCQNNQGKLMVKVQDELHEIKVPPTRLHCQSDCCQQETIKHQELFCWIVLSDPFPLKDIYDHSQTKHYLTEFITGISLSILSCLIIASICLINVIRKQDHYEPIP